MDATRAARCASALKTFSLSGPPHLRCESPAQAMEHSASGADDVELAIEEPQKHSTPYCPEVSPHSMRYCTKAIYLNAKVSVARAKTRALIISQCAAAHRFNSQHSCPHAVGFATFISVIAQRFHRRARGPQTDYVPERFYKTASGDVDFGRGYLSRVHKERG
jgi:hypothetical protein